MYIFRLKIDLNNSFFQSCSKNKKNIAGFMLNPSETLLTICLFILAQSCSIGKNNIAGTYVSNCKAYERPTEVCMLNSDSTFSYEFPIRKGEFIIGKYTLKEDTIVFKSEFIKSGEIKEVVDPNDKYTQLPSLLIKNKGLFTIINYKIYSMNCFLVKQK